MNKINFLQNNFKFLLPNNSTKKLNFTSKPDDFTLSEAMKQRRMEAKEEVEDILSDTGETLTKEEKEKTINDMVKYDADFYLVRHVAGFSDEDKKASYINLFKKIEDTTNYTVGFDSIDELLNKGLDKEQILNLYTIDDGWLKAITDKKLPEEKKNFILSALDDEVIREMKYSAFSPLVNSSEDIEEVRRNFEEAKNLYEEIGEEKGFYIENAITSVVSKIPEEEVVEAADFADSHNFVDFNLARSILKNYSKEEIAAAEETSKKERLHIDDALCYNELYGTVDEEKNAIIKNYPHKLSTDELKEKFDGEINWGKTIHDNYSQLRKTGKYTINYGKDNFSDRVGDVIYVSMLSRKAGVRMSKAGNWSLRHTKRDFDENNIYRASLNVKGSVGLFNQLDDLLKEEKNFEYKFPTDILKWGLREDPVTMYFYGEPSKDLKNKIIKITEPYKRGNITTEENSTTPWIVFEKNPSEEEIDELLDEIKNTNKDFYKEAISNGKDQLTSLGYFNACKMALEQYKEYLETLQ